MLTQAGNGVQGALRNCERLIDGQIGIANKNADPRGLTNAAKQSAAPKEIANAHILPGMEVLKATARNGRASEVAEIKYLVIESDRRSAIGRAVNDHLQKHTKSTHSSRGEVLLSGHKWLQHRVQTASHLIRLA